MQRFLGRLLGVGDAGGESPAVHILHWGRYFAALGLCRCPLDLAVVVPFRVHQVSWCLGTCTSAVAGDASIASQPTSWIGWTTGWAFEGAHMWRT